MNLAREGGYRHQPGIGWRVAANFIPVLGVLLDGWAALPLLVFSRIENVLGGVVGALKRRRLRLGDARPARLA